jgi:hypothetical protein
MQGAGEAAGGVALQVRRIHLHGDHPLQKGAVSPCGGAEAARAAGQSLQGVALACAGLAEEADGERGLRLTMDGQLGQQIERRIVRKGWAHR